MSSNEQREAEEKEFLINLHGVWVIWNLLPMLLHSRHSEHSATTDCLVTWAYLSQIVSFLRRNEQKEEEMQEELQRKGIILSWEMGSGCGCGKFWYNLRSLRGLQPSARQEIPSFKFTPARRLIPFPFTPLFLLAPCVLSLVSFYNLLTSTLSHNSCKEASEVKKIFQLFLRSVHDALPHYARVWGCRGGEGGSEQGAVGADVVDNDFWL